MASPQISSTSSPGLASLNSTIAVIIGTTGVGKSKFSIDLASAYNGEIVNADSMQMYKRCPIITNKHPRNERNGIPHHVMDHVDWDEEYFIHRFQKEALQKITEIQKKGKLPIIVGGTNYYLQSLLFNNKVIEETVMNFEAKKANQEQQQQQQYLTKKEVIKTLSQEQQDVLNSSNPLDLYHYLEEIDPVIAQKFHPNDIRRVKRVVEIYFQTGKRPSEIYTVQQQQQKSQEGERTLTATTQINNLRFNTLIYWIWSKQDVLNERLDTRVDSMIEEGALLEIKELFDLYVKLPKEHQDCQHGIWQVIGFKEFMPWLLAKYKQHGNSTNFEVSYDKNDKLLNDAILKMKQKTKKYSKQQIKWIKNTLIKELSKDCSTTNARNENDNGNGNGSDRQNTNVSRLYLLDASDLSAWQDSVAKNGFKIYENFISDAQTSTHEIVNMPQEIKSILYTNDPKMQKRKQSSTSDAKIKFYGDTNDNNRPNDAANEAKTLIWKQYRCDTCLSKDGSLPLTVVGEEQWNIHLNSRRHRSNLKRLAKKEKHEAWIKRQKKGNEERTMAVQDGEAQKSD